MLLKHIKLYDIDSVYSYDILKCKQRLTIYFLGILSRLLLDSSDQNTNNLSIQYQSICLSPNS